jgi:hypothetical protein
MLVEKWAGCEESTKIVVIPFSGSGTFPSSITLKDVKVKMPESVLSY